MINALAISVPPNSRPYFELLAAWSRAVGGSVVGKQEKQRLEFSDLHCVGLVHSTADVESFGQLSVGVARGC